MKVQYFVKKRKNPYSKIFIRLWESKKFDFMTSTGLQIKYDFWDSKNQKVKNKVEAMDKDFINDKLLTLNIFVVGQFNIDYNDGEVITADWLKNTVNNYFKRPSDLKPEKVFFVDWIKSFVETAPKRLHKGNNLSETTIKKYNTTLNNLINYEAFKGVRLRFEDITLNFYFDFDLSFRIANNSSPFS